MTGPTFAASGPGSVAGFGPRFLAYLIDAVIAQLIAIIVLGGYHVGGKLNLTTYVAFLLIEFASVSIATQTPGMRVVGMAVVPLNGRGRPAPLWVLLRTVLLATVVPALIPDKSGRAMHDRAAGTALLRTR